jgi:phosphatidylserine/phosphatidylglycerophosphate/cardiolipin synthase-like enzyme
MHKFGWSELITPSLLARLGVVAGIGSSVEQDDVGESLSSIFRNTGGLPVVNDALDEARLTELALSLISDAMDRYASRLALNAPAYGFYLDESASDRFTYEIVAVRKLNINTATADELEALPVLGQTLALRVVAERVRGGPFESFDDLSERVAGIGEGAAQVLSHAVIFRWPTPSALDYEPAAGFDDRFRACLGWFQDGDPGSRIARMFDALSSTVADEPHPVSQEKLRRGEIGAAQIATDIVDWVGVLANTDYYRQVPELMKEASSSIRVAMFHAALTSDDHPTRMLLDQLVAAHQRGVSVKVLLDRDRASDPYLSTVINTAAKEFLEAAGVDCRFDTEAALLHSKFLVIDDDTCVIGSHNWSAGSYFRFDDLSIVVGSQALGAELAARFDELWPDLE